MPTNIHRSSHRHRCFSENFAKFLRTPILKNICERLLLHTVILTYSYNSNYIICFAQIWQNISRFKMFLSSLKVFSSIFFSCSEGTKCNVGNTNETTKQLLPLRSTLLKKGKFSDIIALY